MIRFLASRARLGSVVAPAGAFADYRDGGDGTLNIDRETSEIKPGRIREGARAPQSDSAPRGHESTRTSPAEMSSSPFRWLGLSLWEVWVGLEGCAAGLAVGRITEPQELYPP